MGDVSMFVEPILFHFENSWTTYNFSGDHLGMASPYVACLFFCAFKLLYSSYTDEVFIT